MNPLIRNKSRLEVIDALRGLALMAIMLLHNLGHFNFYDFPKATTPFMQSLDTGIWDTLFFIFAGKAYAIFSLLFGFSFYIQYKNEQDKGYDFRGRFLWRITLLLLLGFFNAAFFPGDILVLYAIIAPILVLSCKFSNRVVIIIAVLLLLQPMEWAKFISAWQNPEVIEDSTKWREYSRLYYPFLSQPDFFDMVKSNLSNGQLFSILWGYSHGRFFQTAALFLFGMILGRSGKFSDLENNVSFWKRVLLIGGLLFIPFYLIVPELKELVPTKLMYTPINTILSSFRNFSFAAVLVSVFVLTWRSVKGKKFWRVFVPYGKMSLTNYITQSIVGSFVYYEYGLGLWNDFGPSASFATGFILFIAQLQFCKWWLKHFSQGPFEYLWKKATWINSNR